MAEQITNRAKELLQRLEENAGNILWVAVSIVLILLAAMLANKLISRLIRRIRGKDRRHESAEQKKRVDTVLTLLHSVVRYGVYFIAGGAILSALGLGKAASALLATAGIGGLAIGFGAQNLVRDVVTGLFLMFENQYSVGEFVQLGDVEGTVEAIAVRVTYLRAPKGEQVIIPNGSITKVINHSRGNSTAIVDVRIDYEADIEKAIAVLEKTALAYEEGNRDVLRSQPVIVGVAQLDDSGVTLRTMVSTSPRAHFQVERDLLRLYKEALDENGIAIPYPHVIVQTCER